MLLPWPLVQDAENREQTSEKHIWKRRSLRLREKTGTSLARLQYSLAPYEHQRVNHFTIPMKSHRRTHCVGISPTCKRSMAKKPSIFCLKRIFDLRNSLIFYSSFRKSSEAKWIVKPACSSMGRGIYLIQSVSDIPMGNYCVVSRYVSDPLFINGLKLDLRINVLVTSFGL